jgi:hypothetical protein
VACVITAYYFSRLSLLSSSSRKGNYLYFRINPYNEAAKKGLERLEKQMKVYTNYKTASHSKIQLFISVSFICTFLLLFFAFVPFLDICA